jgi:hypothetical protein
MSGNDPHPFDGAETDPQEKGLDPFESSPERCLLFALYPVEYGTTGRNLLIEQGERARHVAGVSASTSPSCDEPRMAPITRAPIAHGGNHARLFQ